jgi:hypothetical protein
VHGFYVSNDILVPTVDKILTTVNDDLELPNFKRTAMYQLLKNMSFKSGKAKERAVSVDEMIYCILVQQVSSI